MLAIKNTRLILENSIVWNGAVICNDGRILACGPEEEIEIPFGAQVIDANGKYTAPGFVDIHCHGGNDVFFYEDPLRAAELFLPHGTTTLLPALYQTLTYDQFINAIDRIRSVQNTGAGKIIGGLYMEGPFMLSLIHISEPTRPY